MTAPDARAIAERLAGGPWPGDTAWEGRVDAIERALRDYGEAVRRDERERCAELCDAMAQACRDEAGRLVALKRHGDTEASYGGAYAASKLAERIRALNGGGK